MLIVSPVLLGKAVAPSRPREEAGIYWGYTTRLASSLQDVFTQCPFTGGYDCTIGTSERGHVSIEESSFSLPSFSHLLIVLGGLDGIEECVEHDAGLNMSGADASKLFTLWLNTCPSQGSRTIRTEEALLITLAKLSPFIARNS